MSTELKITPIPSGAGGLTLLLQGATLPAGGKQVQRGAPVLDPALLEQFRRANITQAQFNNLSDAVTNWLLDPELRGILAGALPANGEGLRVVIVVPDHSQAPDARRVVSQLPLELLWHDAPDKPLVLRNDVQSLVYLLSKALPPGQTPATRNWPFKVLIVRASPPDLDAVPQAAPIAADIRDRGTHYGPGMVQVDILSSEPGIGKPATWSALRQHLDTTNDYNVLVYLGHSELVSATTEDEPIGQLFMESEDGSGSEAINAPRIARLLTKHPISVVILAGCLTGADPPGVVRQRGGEHGVAQALVNSSDAGVQVAVAMRTELRTTSAVTFLKTFFKSLFDTKTDAAGRLPAGNIDHAVRAARDELYLDGIVPPQWAAPIVLRAVEHEPFIDYLAQSVKFTITHTMDMLLELRATLWKGVGDYSRAQGLPERLQGQATSLAQVQQMIRNEGLQQGPLLLAPAVTLGAGEQGTAIFELAGQLSIVALKGRITTAEGIQVRQVDLPANVAVLFELVTDATDPAAFELRARSAAVTQVPAGEVLRVVLEAPPQTASDVHALAIEIQRMQPPGIVWPGDGIVIVPRP